MTSRHIAEHTTFVLLLLLTAVFLGACAIVVSFDDNVETTKRGGTTDTPTPDATRLYGVRGTVVGLTGSKATLSLNAIPLDVWDGEFVYPALLADGVAYVVAVDRAPPERSCTVVDASGTIRGADVSGVRVECRSNDATLDNIAVADAPLLPAFTPSTSTYRAVFRAAGLFNTPKTTITATAREPNTDLTIGGIGTKSGTPTTVTLNTVVNPFDIIARAPDRTTTRTYSVSVELLVNDFLKASNTRATAFFGKSVAISGDSLAIGSSGESSASTGIDGDQTSTTAERAGAVYIFTRSGKQWSQQAYIKASDTKADAQFGTSVALDGNTLAVGAPWAAADAVYIYTRTGATWSEQARLTPSIGGRNFGASVRLSGETLAVGCYNDSAVYLFQRFGSTWSKQAEIRSTTGKLGPALALEGNTLAIGVWPGGFSAGAVHLYSRTNGVWTLESQITASNGRHQDGFGGSVALDKDTLAVGALGEKSNAIGVNGDQSDISMAFAGAAYIFQRQGTTWSQRAYIKASNTRAGAQFGEVALFGNFLAVGANAETSGARGINGNQQDSAFQAAGAVYLYTRVANTWSQHAYVKASNTYPGLFFGSQVALSADALVVGTTSDSSDATGVNGEANMLASNSGAVYVY